MRASPNQGFTLLELMLAAVLAGFIFIPIGTLLVTSFREPIIQQEMFSREAGADITLQLIREKFRNISYNDVSRLISGSESIGVEFANDEGQTTRIYKSGSELIYLRGADSLVLIEEGVQTFAVDEATNGFFVCTLELEAHTASAPVTYQLSCATRNQ